MIVNRDTDTWGAFKYDAKKDVVRINTEVQKNTEIAELLSMSFEKSGGGINLNIAWEEIKVSLPIALK